MITKFGSLFAGNVDLDNIGLEGTAANAAGSPTTSWHRCFPSARPSAR